MRRVGLLVIVIIGSAIALAPAGKGQQPGEHVEIDSSGHGAVLCTWEIYVTVRNAIDLCFPSEFRALRSDVSEGIEAMNRFIVANSPTPVTLATLDRAIAERMARDRRYLPAGEKAADIRYCKNMRQEFLEPFAKQSHDEFQRSMADLLSVPRIPVLNPCL
jgi:hypothetical protein